MFTNKVKKRSNLTFTSPGWTGGGYRSLCFIEFYKKSNSGNTVFKNSGYYTVTGGSLPDLQHQPPSGTLEAYDDTDRNLIMPAINSGHNWKTRVAYNGTSLLTPRERTIVFTINDTIDVYEIIISSDGHTPSTDNNLNEIGIDNLNDFPNLERFVMSGTRTTTMLNLPSKKLVDLALYDMAQLTDINIPHILETLLVYDNGSTLVGSDFYSDIELNTSLKTLKLGYNNLTRTLASINNNRVTRQSTGFASLSLLNNLDIEELVLHCGNSNPTLTLNDFNNIVHIALDGHTTYNNSSQLVNILTQDSCEKFVMSDFTGLTLTHDLVIDTVNNPNLVKFGMENSGFNGSITASNNSNIEDIYMWGNASNPNNITSVDISNCTNIDFIGLIHGSLSSTSTITFSNLPNIDRLYLSFNEINYTLNSSLISEINSLTSLTWLTFTSNSHVDGITNPNLSNLSNLEYLYFTDCNVIGSLTLPSSHVSGEYVEIRVENNPNLTSIVNFNTITQFTGVLRFDNTPLDLDLSNITTIKSLYCNKSNQTVIDLSNCVPISNVTVLQIHICSNLTSVTLPTQSFNFTNHLHAQDCNITTFNNLDSINLTNNSRYLYLYGNTNLNIPIVFSSTPYNRIRLEDCAFDLTNIDNLLNHIWVNISDYTYSAPSLNISGGTNAIPSGTYQDPSGSPTTPQEVIWELVNNYNWTITTN